MKLFEPDPTGLQYGKQTNALNFVRQNTLFAPDTVNTYTGLELPRRENRATRRPVKRKVRSEDAEIGLDIPYLM